MSDLHRARARAETFAHAVDHGPRHSSRLSDDPELEEAVELVGRLRTAGAVAPRPEFSAELRHRLLEQAAARAATTTPTMVRSTPDSSDDPPSGEDVDASVTDIRHRHGRRIRLVASTAALVLLGGGIGSAAAAQQAMPGDTLYGMKRSIENVATNVGIGDDSRGRRDLEHAKTRLSEVQALAANGGSATTINGTLDDFSAQARKGVSRLVASYQQDGDASAITAVTAFITSARQGLVGLGPKLPPESLKSAVEALATIDQLAQHANSACPKCDKPKPPKNQPVPSTVGETVEPPSGKLKTPPVTNPSSGPSSKPTTTPSKVPNTTIVGESQTPPPSGLKTPPRPSTKPSGTPSGTPTGPSTSPSWPWPFPSLTLPPILNLPGVLQTLLPPWK
ncbi:hypothetical protein E1263_01985 [Kribbella antibiotica]|uniref:DUF5667 domain-containing protein n=1 Tax=Kribbella antibiotica TaxID=190195 RepID=A0A4R4ZV87_9ACTN|nr:DUF5667 domain-containing protein [Kribbella antibiotica]TDD63098.1 hypothetical protein E1263_01985 [Kribbella antibiotica]